MICPLEWTFFDHCLMCRSAHTKCNHQNSLPDTIYLKKSVRKHRRGIVANLKTKRFTHGKIAVVDIQML